MAEYRVVELLGDGISPELSKSVHQVAKCLDSPLRFVSIDLSDERRQQEEAKAYGEAVNALKEHGVGIKYPTATTSSSPNRVLRERCEFAVIHRPVRTLEGVRNNFKKTIDIDIVRIATGGTYEDPGRRLGLDTAVSLRVIERRPAMLAARFAFDWAMKSGKGVVGSSKYTIQKATDGLFQEAVEIVAKDYPSVPYRRELFDALLAGIVMRPEAYGVVVCPNEYGDFLSDAACGLIGSIGLGESASYAFDDGGKVSTAMFDPSGGTAPDIAGKDLANPTAALLAFSSLLNHLGEEGRAKALRESLLGCIAEGICTRDIGGRLSTTAFVDAVVGRIKSILF